jgi:hypothetical protein
LLENHPKAALIQLYKLTICRSNFSFGVLLERSALNRHPCAAKTPSVKLKSLGQIAKLATKNILIMKLSDFIHRGAESFPFLYVLSFISYILANCLRDKCIVIKLQQLAFRTDAARTVPHGARAMWDTTAGQDTVVQLWSCVFPQRRLDEAPEREYALEIPELLEQHRRPAEEILTPHHDPQ